MRLLIWGAGVLAHNYVRQGYFDLDEIVGFVDTYKKEETFIGYPVYSPDKIEGLCYDRLLVCVLKSNKEILKLCTTIGIDIEKLYFIHNEVIYDGVTEEPFVSKTEQIKRDYPLIAKHIQGKKEQYLFFNDERALSPTLEETVIIKNDDRTHIVVWIPIELLFSEKREDILYVKAHTVAWEEQNKKFQDIPIISFQPYRSLYNFFLNGDAFPEAYCQWFQNLFETRGMKSGMSDEELIEKRFREFALMKSALQKDGLNFFIDNPAMAVWNNLGYFNLMDGHHRTTFLYYSGFGKIPVQITVSDYEKWSNFDLAKKVKDIIIKEHRKDFYQPILNPFFLNINTHRDMTVKNRLHILLEYINNTRFRGKKVIDIGANLGYFGHAFARLGAEVTLLEPDPYHYELMEAVSKLLYMGVKIVTSTFEEYESEEVFDVAIMLTVFYRYMENKTICTKFMEHLNKNVSQMIFWESGDEIEKEKQYIVEHTKFKHFVHLGYTFGTGKFRELGLFIVDDSDI